MTYWEIYYGKCKAKPLGSPKCCAYCEECAGLNWIPLGPKTFEEMLEYHKNKAAGTVLAIVPSS